MMETGVNPDQLAFNLTWHDWLNLRSLCDISEVIALAGLRRENSRGAHYREDFPDDGGIENSDFTVVRQVADRHEVSKEPVLFNIVSPGETILPEGEPETLVAAQ
jgi:fumarate reductase flavoprotein subunit